MRLSFKVKVFAPDGCHHLSSHKSLDRAKAKIEAMCEGEYLGCKLEADWIGPMSAIGPFGDRYCIEKKGGSDVG